MTSKELLYVEDALGHEKLYEAKCNEIASKISDTELKSCIEDLKQKHKSIFENLYGLL